MRSFSHSLFIKTIAFIIVIACFSGLIVSSVNLLITEEQFDIFSEDNYYESNRFIRKVDRALYILQNLIHNYKSEENVLSGGVISVDEFNNRKGSLYWEFKQNSNEYNPNADEDINYKKFEEVYADRITEEKNRLINKSLKRYNELLHELSENKGIIYYAGDGINIFSNTTKSTKEKFRTYPSYIILGDFTEEVYPVEIKNNRKYHYISNVGKHSYSKDNIIYLAFTEEYLNGEINIWKEKNTFVKSEINKLIIFLVGFLISFIYLIIITGRNNFKDKKVNLNTLDRIYTDINILLCSGLILIWFLIMNSFYYVDILNDFRIVGLLTSSISIIGLLLILSLVKHIKNKTLIKHSLIFTIFHKIFEFIRNVYNSGSLGIKVVLIVIGYPILVATTIFIILINIFRTRLIIFMFPLIIFMFLITIGVAARLTYKKVKEFNVIKDGVERIKSGDIHHKIGLESKGEFSELANNINSIADGLNKAIDNELKSERLKTELITNVSHDIRTPLTSIITYVDLLKSEEDPIKRKEYIEILDKKSQRLKTLTDDLFEAAKATSGNVPVNFEKIDIISLMTQGLGEFNEKLENLDFRVNYPEDKLYITADGKLLWRAIENLLSNIIKYALKGSRVYIDIVGFENEIILTMKNISAYELNISGDELMERFKRGDESRSSQGSGLGLSITKSLIDIQKGTFDIKIDGDLFKTIIKMPRYKNIKEE